MKENDKKENCWLWKVVQNEEHPKMWKNHAENTARKCSKMKGKQVASRKKTTLFAHLDPLTAAMLCSDLLSMVL